jgi:hypothetical protein
MKTIEIQIKKGFEELLVSGEVIQLIEATNEECETKLIPIHPIFFLVEANGEWGTYENFKESIIQQTSKLTINEFNFVWCFTNNLLMNFSPLNYKDNFVSDMVDYANEVYENWEIDFDNFFKKLAEMEEQDFLYILILKDVLDRVKEERYVGKGVISPLMFYNIKFNKSF